MDAFVHRSEWTVLLCILAFRFQSFLSLGLLNGISDKPIKVGIQEMSGNCTPTLGSDDTTSSIVQLMSSFIRQAGVLGEDNDYENINLCFLTKYDWFLNSGWYKLKQYFGIPFPEFGYKCCMVRNETVCCDDRLHAIEGYRVVPYVIAVILVCYFPVVLMKIGNCFKSFDVEAYLENFSTNIQNQSPTRTSHTDDTIVSVDKSRSEQLADIIEHITVLATSALPVIIQYQFKTVCPTERLDEYTIKSFDKCCKQDVYLEELGYFLFLTISKEIMFSIILLFICMKYIDSVSVRKSDDITTKNSTPSSLLVANRELEVLRSTVNDLSVELQTLEDKYEKEKTAPVMFYAVIRNRAISYNVDAIIVFETVIVNEGGHYNNYDGVFLAPEKGTYIFAWTVTSSSTNFIISELVVENNVIAGTGEQHKSSGYPSAAMTSLCKMEKGDHAWIRTTGYSSGHYLYSHDDYPQSGFLGLMVLTE
ncbi:unnamed protein product [Mytilus coruscus]|uniref:C1q domain-containing protein n=1 Tax=Mytilus coruscus TaxID=42192 RepID=A0A6J8C528_MYTCO|nr:unnamed protein product [Mytilus coruscus]